MYSPNLFSSDLYGLWSNEHQTALNLMSNQKRNNTHVHSINGHITNTNAHDNMEEINKEMRLLFAPPLLAYSAEYTGASLVQLENTIRAGSSSSLPPSMTIHRKLERAQKIRMYGYSTIRPIGINKTMEQLKYEEARKSNLNDTSNEYSPVPTAENSTSNAQDSFSGIHDRTGEENSEADLDADIPNVDSNEEEGFDDYDDSDNEESEEVDDNHINEDDGFMAEDVEYQDDHSISTDMNMLINSSTLPSISTSNRNISFNTIQSTSSSVNVVGNNTSGIFSLPRGQISLDNEGIYQNSDDENNENNENNENDENGENYSDLDMVIDEN